MFERDSEILAIYFLTVCQKGHSLQKHFGVTHELFIQISNRIKFLVCNVRLQIGSMCRVHDSDMITDKFKLIIFFDIMPPCLLY